MTYYCAQLTRIPLTNQSLDLELFLQKDTEENIHKLIGTDQLMRLAKYIIPSGTLYSNERYLHWHWETVYCRLFLLVSACLVLSLNLMLGQKTSVNKNQRVCIVYNWLYVHPTLMQSRSELPDSIEPKRNIPYTQKVFISTNFCHYR